MTTFYVKAYISQYPESKGEVVAYLGSNDYVDTALKERILFTVDLPYRNVATIPNRWFGWLGELAKREYTFQRRLEEVRAEVRETYVKAFRLGRKLDASIGFGREAAFHGARRAASYNRQLNELRAKGYGEIVDCALTSVSNGRSIDPLAVPARVHASYDHNHGARLSSRLTGRVLQTP